MKVTVDQISEGVATYVDRELVPKAPGIRKWMLGLSGAYLGKMVADKAREHKDLLVGMGLMTEDGLVDIDQLASHMKRTASMSGPVTEHFPVIGDITFDSSDIDKLHTYIVS